MGSHSKESDRRVTRLVARAGVAVGVAAALVGVVLAVNLRPGADPAPAAASLTLADSRRAEAAITAEERASRSRVRAPLTVTTAPTPPKAVAKRWVTIDVNVRAEPASDAKRVGSLKARTQVGITGETQKGWSQLVLGKRTGWVKTTYLVKDKPSIKPQATKPANCKISATIVQHLTANARAVYQAVCAAYGSSVSSFGGYRAGDDGDHGTGRAVDIMVSGDPGKTIARYVQAHYKELHVTYVIYQQKIWMAGDPVSQWKAMEDRGSVTANHYDHVHVSVS